MVVRLGACKHANHNAIARSVPFFLSRVHLQSSSTRASVFQFPRIVGIRSAPERASVGMIASIPRFWSSLLRAVVWGRMLTPHLAVHLRTKSC